MIQMNENNPLNSFKQPTSKSADKTNNIYASAHSIASGLVGLVTVFILTTPFYYFIS